MDRKGILAARVSVFIVSICFIAMGIMRNEHFVVFKKAVKICLECIGLG